jgi:mannose-6-phosphate isomerase-like protein (cupin superfamily)
VLEGGGTVRVGKRAYEVGVGDCFAIGLGHSHDFSTVTEPVKAVFFETTLEGAKRIGHLWAHTHGASRPAAERV